MGRTNIRSAHDILQRTKQGTDDQAMIEPSGQPVHILATSFEQMDIDVHSKILREPILNKWQAQTRSLLSETVVVSLPQPDHIPKIQMSEDFGTSKIKEDLLHFIIIFQGKEASTKSKIVLSPSRERVGVEVLHEALNAYSTVFTAGVLKIHTPKLFQRLWVVVSNGRRVENVFPQFIAVKSVEELLAIAEEHNREELGHRCSTKIGFFV